MTAAKLLTRIQANAEHLIETYPTASRLLADAMTDAAPWVLALKMNGRTPSLMQLERLTTQLLAILMAGTPEPDLPPEPPPTARILRMK